MYFELFIDLWGFHSILCQNFPNILLHQLPLADSHKTLNLLGLKAYCGSNEDCFVKVSAGVLAIFSAVICAYPRKYRRLILWVTRIPRQNDLFLVERWRHRHVGSAVSGMT